MTASMTPSMIGKETVMPRTKRILAVFSPMEFFSPPDLYRTAQGRHRAVFRIEKEPIQIENMLEKHVDTLL